MAHKAIREADGKRMLARLLNDYSEGKFEISDKIVTVDTRYRHDEAAESKQVANDREVSC